MILVYKVRVKREDELEPDFVLVRQGSASRLENNDGRSEVRALIP